MMLYACNIMPHSQKVAWLLRHNKLLRLLSVSSRMFQKLSTLMGEEGNCILYHKETGQNIEKEVPFVPYLGFFLTQIVHQACHQQMSDKKVVEFKRRGAMLKRYKSHPPIIISSARSDEDGGIACSDPCDLTNALSSQIDESCKISCGLTGNATISVSYDAVTPLSVEIDAVTPSINEDFFNDASAFSPPYNSPPPHSPEFCSLSTLDSLHPPMVCSISFSSSPFSTLQPCSLSKSHSAELMCPQGKGTFLADKSPVPMMLNMSLSSEALDSKVSNLELECHPKLQKPGDGGSGVCRFADSGVCLNESSSSIKEAGLHGSGNSPVHGSSRERLRGDQVSPLQCSPRHSVVPEEQCSGEVEGHRALSKCLTLNVHSPCAPTRHPASADRSSSLGCRLATTLGCVDLKQLLRNPKELLSRYQICSLSCAINVQSKEDVRNLISNHHCNTEMENYVLSYQREPP